METVLNRRKWRSSTTKQHIPLRRKEGCRVGFKKVICSDFDSKLNQYFNGKLDLLQVARLERHIKICPSCTAIYKETSTKRNHNHDNWDMFSQGEWEGFITSCLSMATLRDYQVGRLQGEEFK